MSANPDTVSQTREGRDLSSSPDMSNPLSLLYFYPKHFLEGTGETLIEQARRFPKDTRFQQPPDTTKHHCLVGQDGWSNAVFGQSLIILKSLFSSL